MFPIKGLRLNGYKYVAIPSRREMFQRLCSSGKLSSPEYNSGSEPTDPVNIYDNMNKIELNATARYLHDQQEAEKKK